MSQLHERGISISVCATGKPLEQMFVSLLERRRGPYEQWVALLTLMRKSAALYPDLVPTLLPSAITMSLYFLIFGVSSDHESARWAVSAT